MISGSRGRARSSWPGAARLWQAEVRPFCRHQHGRDPARPHRERIVRAREREPSPARRPARSDVSSRRKDGRFFSTRSATCRWRRKRACCVSCSRANTRRSADGRRSRPTCGLWRPQPNKDLRFAIQQGAFREDLFFRLNVVPIRIPPCAERSEDIPDPRARFLSAGRRRGTAAEGDRTLGDGAHAALSVAGQRPRTGKSDTTVGCALSAGGHLRFPDRIRN